MPTSLRLLTRLTLMASVPPKSPPPYIAMLAIMISNPDLGGDVNIQTIAEPQHSDKSKSEEGNEIARPDQVACRTLEEDARYAHSRSHTQFCLIPEYYLNCYYFSW